MIRLALMAPAALLAGAAAVGPSVAVVEVRESGADGVHLVFPIPLAAARGALATVPDGAWDQRGSSSPYFGDHLAQTAPALSRFVVQLRRTSDAELARVEDGGDTVSIRKLGDELRVRVQGADGQDVRVDVPLAAVERLAASCRDGRLTAREVSWAMGSLARGRLLDVRDGGDRVRVWLF